MGKLQMVMPRTGPAPCPVLEVVGQLAVPPAALQHRFFTEAHANAQLADQPDREDGERVVGTSNTRAVELYAWGSNVFPHVDNTGFMYLMPLALERSVLYVQHREAFHEQRLQVGQVVRLWDFARHWTEDSAPVVAAFIGGFSHPDDAFALQQLRNGVAALARGDYSGAPRVATGYRVLMRDEALSYGDVGDDLQPVLLADAARRGRQVLQCAQCDEPAVAADHHWPYSWDGNVCREHQRLEARHAAA